MLKNTAPEEPKTYTGPAPGEKKTEPEEVDPLLEMVYRFVDLLHSSKII